MAHIVSENPILFENLNIRKEYVKRLKHYLKIAGWNNRKYESALIRAYEKIIKSNDEIKYNNSIEFYQNYIVLDLIHLLRYEISDNTREKLAQIEKQYILDFSIVDQKKNIFYKIIKYIKMKNFKKLSELLYDEAELKYVESIKKNITFRNKKPYTVMVTATMSAGKSTFINSLIGKYVCLSQNMACTSKIHSIINKSFEDGYSYKYDYDLIMTAEKEELLNDNELNTSNRIYVSTHYDGKLSEERIIINDSPGVNFSSDIEHKIITRNLIKSRKFNLLIYIMNSTQLATNDEDDHLNFIKQIIGRIPIIFVMNKIDSYNIEDENVIETIHRQIEYLQRKGFKNPIVCPISAKAGYLAKKYATKDLTRSEKRQLYNYADKFDQMKLSDYYKEKFPLIKIKDSNIEEEQLLKTCGLSYIEQIIKWYIKGVK